MKSIILWFGKKYAISAVKEMVACNSEEVSTWTLKINKWIDKIEAVLKFLRDTSTRLADGDLTTDEAEEIISEAKELADTIV